MNENPLTQALQTSTKKRQQQPAETKPRKRHVRVKGKKPAVTKKPQSREGKSLIGGFFSPEINRTIKILAAKQSTTTQALVEEGLRAVFKKYGEAWPE